MKKLLLTILVFIGLKIWEIAKLPFICAKKLGCWLWEESYEYEMKRILVPFMLLLGIIAVVCCILIAAYIFFIQGWVINYLLFNHALSLDIFSESIAGNNQLNCGWLGLGFDICLFIIFLFIIFCIPKLIE